MDARNTDELIRYLANGASAKYVYFWGHTPSGSEVDQSCLSQWFPSDFKIDGHCFATAEHFMMFNKAELFGDQKAATQVLSSPSPGAAKSVGRLVLDFDHSVWVEHRWDIVVAGNLAKFSQNASISSYLLNTGSRVLVEASPVDPIWGIGMDKATAVNAHPKEWQGDNILGFALMEVRDQLRNAAV